MDCLDDHGIHLATSLDIENESDIDISSHMDSMSENSLINFRSIHKSGQQQSTNLPLLTACYISALTVGATTYAFSFYSNDLKTSLNLSQNQLDTLSSATFCAGIFSWLPGMVVDFWGARRAMALGGTSNAIILSLYWVIATEHVKLHDIEFLMFLLSALSVVTFMGCALITGSVFKVIVESCSSGTKGKAVGCAKGYVGVGSGVYVCLFGALFGSSSYEEGGSDSKLKSLNFLLMAAVLSFLAATLPALLFLPKQSPTSPTSAYQSRRDGTRSIHFRVVYVGLISLGIWVVGTSLLNLRLDEQAKNNGGASGVDPSILNKTLSEDITMARELFDSSRVLISSSAGMNWGNAFMILLLWWGPALSLLCLPPRNEFAGDATDSIEENAYDGNDEHNLETDGVNGRVDACINVEDEDTFLHDGIGRVSFGLKYGEISSSELDDSLGAGSDHVLDASDREFTLLQMLRTSPAWLMAWTYLILVGGGTLMTTNIGQMTEALGFDHATTSASLALFSAAQGASRVCTGIASEISLGWSPPRFCRCLLSSNDTGIPRPAFLVLASLVGAAAHFVLAISTSEGAFVFGVTLAGLSFGMVWPMMVLITGEFFGVAHVGANYMWFDGMSSAVGTLLISKVVAQEVYDEHIVREESGGEGNFKCTGLGCFAMTHAIVSLLSLTCIVSSFALIKNPWSQSSSRRDVAS
ncbi:hypothetical protein ACHAW5_003303 [Stephanodiscus triporus]|uniref:Nodulin-like domain-containing protein n=1 Tax=Stephanodiscus triporus TaxID=2934178 RepID=A0ABD3QC02_9STRA